MSALQTRSRRFDPKFLGQLGPAVLALARKDLAAGVAVGSSRWAQYSANFPGPSIQASAISTWIREAAAAASWPAAPVHGAGDAHVLLQQFAIAGRLATASTPALLAQAQPGAVLLGVLMGTLQLGIFAGPGPAKTKMVITPAIIGERAGHLAQQYRLPGAPLNVGFC